MDLHRFGKEVEGWQDAQLQAGNRRTDVRFIGTIGCTFVAALEQAQFVGPNHLGRLYIHAGVVALAAPDAIEPSYFDAQILHTGPSTMKYACPEMGLYGLEPSLEFPLSLCGPAHALVPPSTIIVPDETPLIAG